MTRWFHELGKHLLKGGALTYLVSDEDPVLWDDDSKKKQKIDMLALYQDHLAIIELKATESPDRKIINYKQIRRYQWLCKDTHFPTEFWLYIYWKKYKIITGILVNSIENMRVYAIERDGEHKFIASIGADPETRVERLVDFRMKIKDDQM